MSWFRDLFTRPPANAEGLPSPVSDEPASGMVPEEVIATKSPNRRQLVLLHALVVIVLSYQLIFSRTAIIAEEVAHLAITGLLLSIVCLAAIPERFWLSRWFTGGLVLGDTAITTAMIYASGAANSNFYVAYFLILLIAALVPTLSQLMVLTVVLCLAYGAVLYLDLSEHGSLNESQLLQIPILMILGIYYGVSNHSARQLNQDKQRLLREMQERRRVEEALRESEQRFHAFMDNSPSVAFIKDATGRMLYVNKTFERYFALSKTEWEGKKDLQLWPEPVARRLKDNDRHVLKYDRTIEIEESVPMPDGQIRAFMVFKFPLKDSTGRRLLGGIAIDITDRKESEQALRLTTEQFRCAFENAPIGMALVSLEGRCLRVNQALCHLVGYAESELRDATIQTLMDPDDRVFEWSSLCRALAGSIQADPVEKRFVHKHGHHVWVLINASLVQDSEERPIYYVVQMQDITPRKAAEDALKESEERYRRLVEVSPDAILIVRGMRIIFVNQTGFRLLGAVSPDQVINRSPLDFFDPDHDPDRLNTISQAIRSHEALSPVGHRLIRLDGASVDVEVAASALPFEKAVVSQVVVRDVTRQKQLEQRLNHSHKMEAIGQLAGGVAHDFNNMLTVINGHSALLLMDTVRLGDDQIRSLEQIQQAGSRAAGLTSQLLAFSRRQMLQPKVVDLNVVITRLQDMLKPLLGEDIELYVLLDPALNRIKADPVQLEQVVINLAVNARDAMPEGGRLTVQTENVDLAPGFESPEGERHEGPYIRMTVSDSGVGMDASVLGRIFEPFFTTKPKGKGTGLGLATVYGIVKQSGGTILVNSEPGRGTTFQVYLPATKAPMDESDRASETDDLRGTETILVVEDEPAVRALVCDTLRVHGYGVLQAPHGFEAILQARHHVGPIHVLLTDVVMPQMGGRELAKELSSALPDLRVLYMSGYTDDAVFRHGVMTEGVNFLQKPFTTVALLRKIRKILGDVPPSCTVGVPDQSQKPHPGGDTA